MIRVERLTRRYGAAVVVDGLTFTVAAGELLVLLGGSGSGKTTTLKMINRLIEPTAGSVALAASTPRACPRSSCAGASVTCSSGSGCFRT